MDFCRCFPTGRTTSAEGGVVFPHRARYQRRRGSGRTLRRRPCGAAPTSPPEGVFRHKRRMELDELSGRITGRLGYTFRLQPTPSEGRQRWHYYTLSPPHLPPPALFLRDDCGLPGAVGEWAPPPLPGRVVLMIDSERFFLVQLTAVEERRKNHLNLLLRVLSSKVHD